MNTFKIEITSVPDRANLVAEIWFGENLIAEVNHESDEPVIKLYSSQKMVFDLGDFLSVLQTAKNKLLE
jgi:hypothetical protein